MHMANWLDLMERPMVEDLQGIEDDLPSVSVGSNADSENWSRSVSPSIVPEPLIRAPDDAPLPLTPEVEACRDAWGAMREWAQASAAVSLVRCFNSQVSGLTGTYWNLLELWIYCDLLDSRNLPDLLRLTGLTAPTVLNCHCTCAYCTHYIRNIYYTHDAHNT